VCSCKISALGGTCAKCSESLMFILEISLTFYVILVDGLIFQFPTLNLIFCAKKSIKNYINTKEKTVDQGVFKKIIIGKYENEIRYGVVLCTLFMILELFGSIVQKLWQTNTPPTSMAQKMEWKF